MTSLKGTEDRCGRWKRGRRIFCFPGAGTPWSGHYRKRLFKSGRQFPNHVPNPENKEAMKAICDAVVKNHGDLGLIFDTDVDRMSAVLSDGTPLNRDSIIAMISAILAPDYPAAPSSQTRLPPTGLRISWKRNWD